MDVLLRSEPIAFFFELYRSGEPPRIWLLIVGLPLVEASDLLPLALPVVWSSRLIWESLPQRRTVPLIAVGMYLRFKISSAIAERFPSINDFSASVFILSIPADPLLLATWR